MLLSFVLNIEHSHSALYLLGNLGYESLINILVSFRSLIFRTSKDLVSIATDLSGESYITLMPPTLA